MDPVDACAQLAARTCAARGMECTRSGGARLGGLAAVVMRVCATAGQLGIGCMLELLYTEGIGSGHGTHHAPLCPTRGNRQPASAITRVASYRHTIAAGEMRGTREPHASVTLLGSNRAPQYAAKGGCIITLSPVISEISPPPRRGPRPRVGPDRRTLYLNANCDVSTYESGYLCFIWVSRTSVAVEKYNVFIYNTLPAVYTAVQLYGCTAVRRKHPIGWG